MHNQTGNLRLFAEFPATIKTLLIAGVTIARRRDAGKSLLSRPETSHSHDNGSPIIARNTLKTSVKNHEEYKSRNDRAPNAFGQVELERRRSRDPRRYPREIQYLSSSVPSPLPSSRPPGRTSILSFSTDRPPRTDFAVPQTSFAIGGHVTGRARVLVR